MTKKPSEFSTASLTKEQRQARAAFRAVEAGKAMTDHEKSQRSFHDNRERLKAERLAREAASQRPNQRAKAPGEHKPD